MSESSLGILAAVILWLAGAFFAWGVDRLWPAAPPYVAALATAFAIVLFGVGALIFGLSQHWISWPPWQTYLGIGLGAIIVAAFAWAYSLHTHQVSEPLLKRSLSLAPSYAKTTGTDTVKKFEIWLEAANQHNALLRYQVEGVAIAIRDKVVFASGKTAEVELAKGWKTPCRGQQHRHQ